MRCIGYLRAQLTVSYPFTRRFFQDTHAMHLLTCSNTSHEALKNAKAACRKPSNVRFLTAVTVHLDTHQSPPMDKNAPPHAEQFPQTRARQTHSVRLQW